MTTSVAPPGWHPDPSNPSGAFRWWDGTAWTAHTQQAPAAAPVAAAPVPAPAQSYGNPYAPVPAQSYGNPYGNPYGTATTPAQSYGSPYGTATTPAQSYGNPYGTATTPAQSYGSPYGTATAPSGNYYPAGFGAPANLNFAKQNNHSLIAMGVAAAYILIAMTAHIVFVGIIPIMFSIRAFKARERFAPVALIAAIIAVVFAFAALR